MSAILIMLIIIALIFEFINGFHDTANVVATSIATRSLSPYQAIIVAAIFNFLGAYFSTGVAQTITNGLFNANLVSHQLLAAALLAAIGWNLLTWYLGVPSSSSHTLIGALLGGIVISSGKWCVIKWASLISKVILPMLISPLVGFIIALMIMVVLTFLLGNNNTPRQTNNFIRELQVLSAGLLAFSHGANDAQKTMAVLTLALFSFGIINTTVNIPHWVVVTCAIAMGSGTLAGGMKIIKTLSSRLAKLKPANGFAAELSSGLLIMFASHCGLPISTTQATTGSIMGAAYNGRSTNWHTVRMIITSWVITLPASALLSAGLYKLLTSASA